MDALAAKSRKKRGLEPAEPADEAPATEEAPVDEAPRKRRKALVDDDDDE